MDDCEEDFLEQMLADEQAMEEEQAAMEATMDYGGGDFPPDMFEGDSRSSASKLGGGGGGVNVETGAMSSPSTLGPSSPIGMMLGEGQRRRIMDDDEEEEEGGAGEGEEGEGGEAAAGGSGKKKYGAAAMQAPLPRPALLALRLAKEGARKKRMQMDREMEDLPDMESDDWRRSSYDDGKEKRRRKALLMGEEEEEDMSSMDKMAQAAAALAGGGGAGGGGGGGTTARSAALKRRKLLSSKGATEEAVAFGLENQVFATAVLVPERLQLPVSVREKYLLSRPPIDSPSISLLTASGNMVYVRKTEKMATVDASLPLASRLAKLQSDLTSGGGRGGGGGGGLLSLPIDELMKQVERRRYARLAFSKKRKEEAAAAKENNKPADDEEEEEGEGTKKKKKDVHLISSHSMAGPTPQEQLWVNRYSPSAFPHLLSDEAINREVLRLIRSWDEFVFKKALSKTLAEPTNQQAGWKSTWRGGNYNNNNNNNNNNNTHTGTGSHPQQPSHHKGGEGGDEPLENKRDKRPKIRAILLCGPPGMGKTTLAHVVANHCGYRPFEINASDDRSAPVLREKITRAMQNQSMLGDKRPNCVILDEVDGIDGKTGIKMIVDMIKAPLSSNNQQQRKKGEAVAAGGSVPPMTRPLICICNDLYAPQLRALREVAAVFRFRKTSSTRLLQRLRTICLAEGLPLESTALGALCEASGNDVRSCLNTLQFFKSKVPSLIAASGSHLSGAGGEAALSSSLSRSLVMYIGAGLKDQEKDLLQVCNVIFRKPTNKPSAAAMATSVLLPGEEEEAASTSSKNKKHSSSTSSSSSSSSITRKRDTDLVISMVAAFSDHNQILAAMHENFLHMRYTDPNLTKTALASDWMAFSDLIQGRQMEGQYHLMEDLHLATAASLHLLCRIELRPKISLPKKDFEYRSAHLSRQHILHSFMEGCSLHSLWARNPAAIVQDVISPLMDILNPSLRAMNPDLYTFNEKAALRHLVHVMMSCGVSFVQSLQNALQHQGQTAGGMHQPLEMVPALEHLAMFGVANDGSNKSEILPVQRPRPARILPNFVKLVATQEAKLEAMKRAERRRIEVMKAKNGGVLPPLFGTANGAAGGAGAGGGGKMQLKRSASFKTEANKKGKFVGEDGVKVEAAAAEEAEEEEELPKGPQNWFVKLGTKRSTTSKAKAKAQALAAVAAAGKDNEREDAKGTNREGEKDGEGGGGGEEKKEEKPKLPLVRFKYVAGFTNAVRRKVFMKDLL